MLGHFDKMCDFKVFYEYINEIGSELSVLKIPQINKSKLKSNHYWVMVLLSKLENLQVLKFYNATWDQTFFKFMQKGFNYMHENKRGLKKLKMTGFG